MKFFTSYFYQVRNVPRNAVCFSTALSDPAWFHDGRAKSYQYLDHRGVMNGLRADVFAPGSSCEGLCSGSCEIKSELCAFKSTYRKQLDKLPFAQTIEELEQRAQKVADFLKLDKEPIILFLVHEAPQNPCSERAAIQEWFRKNGKECTEWAPMKD